MIAAPTYQAIVQMALRRAQSDYEADSDAVVRMYGIIFAPKHIVMRNGDIENALNYWDRRSGKILDFAWAGYSNDCSDPGAEEVFGQISGTGNHLPRYFSADRYEELRRELEIHTKWKHKDTMNLILINSVYDAEANEVAMDAPSALLVDLENSARNNVFGGTITGFMDRLLTETERRDGSSGKVGYRYDPVRDFGKVLSKAELTQYTLSFLRSLAVPAAIMNGLFSTCVQAITMN